MTIPIFWQEPYLKECTAKVVRTEGDLVFLDRTIFFPGGGGQVPDTGKMGGLMPATGGKTPEGALCHIVPGNRFSPGQEVGLELDWERRHRIMRLHSAAHIVYFLFKEFDPEMTGTSGNVDERKDRSDYLFKRELDLSKILPEINGKAKELISKNLPIEIREEQREGFGVNPWTGAPESGKEAGTRRVWRLGSWEMECGGTHVKSTGEIGELKISKGKAPGGGRKRIEVELV
ncbi:MAG: alanyl-tRNA editing protein [archaeon]